MSTAEEALKETDYDAAREHALSQQRLEEKLRQIEVLIADTRRRVEDGGRVNSLGVLQQAGSEIDRLCALYMEAKERDERSQRRMERAGLEESTLAKMHRGVSQAVG